MSGKSWSMDPPKNLKAVKLDTPSVSSLLLLPPLESGGIVPIACPARTQAGALSIEKGLKGNDEAILKEPRPLLANSCYSCVMIAHCYSKERWQRCILAQGPRPLIDTLQLRFQRRLETGQIQGWKTITVKDGAFSHITNQRLYRLDNGGTIHLTYFPRYFRMGSNLFARFSLPKLLHGDNFLLVPPLEVAVRYLTILLNRVPDLPELDPWKGELSEVHVAYNFSVGDLVPHYIKSLEQSHFPHRKTVHYPGEGVEYLSKQARCRFYDKGIESGNPVARGFIRQETVLRSKDIRKRIHERDNPMKEITLQAVTEVWMYSLLKKDHRALGILDRPFGNYDRARKALFDRYGPTKGMRLYGLLETQQELGSRKQIMRETGISSRSIQKGYKDIADAGISPVLVDFHKSLPSLLLQPPPGYLDDANCSQSTN